MLEEIKEDYPDITEKEIRIIREIENGSDDFVKYITSYTGECDYYDIILKLRSLNKIDDIIKKWSLKC